jgi:energy-coupling factor transport system ATP-binding protein
LRLEKVGFTYPAADDDAPPPGPALQDLDFEAEEGSWLGVLGAAGSGKSTLSCLPNGLIPHFVRGRLSGRVLLEGRDTRQWKVAQAATRVGLVMQDFDNQIFTGRVDLEVAFAAENLGLPREEIGRRLQACLQAVGLAGQREKDPFQLSGGQRQRLVLAAVMAGQPRMLVLDAAWSDLDPAGGEELARALRRLGAGGLVTESEPELLPPVERLLLLHQGRALALGEPARILGDEELLARAGLPLPSLAELFRQAGESARPLNVEEALPAFRLSLAPDAAARLQRQDEEYRQRLGQVVLEVEDLGYRYPDGTEALRGVSFALRRGERVALLGRNGSGKSTLARHFVGLLRPTAGRVRVHGREISTLRTAELGSQIAYIHQNPDQQIFAQTVGDEVAFAPRNLGLPADEVARRVAEALATVGLAGREHEDPFSLTRGERQRVAVASALAAQPGILVFDEPTTGLDPAQIQAMMELVERLAEQGHTVLFITHHMEVAARYARRLLLLEGGRLVADGPTRQVLHRPGALEQAGLRRPPVAELAARLGVPACWWGELLACRA